MPDASPFPTGSRATERQEPGDDPAGGASAGRVVDTGPSLIGRNAELELRLRERVDENRALDEEVRCLRAERRVRDQYIESLEESCLRLPEMERELEETKASLAALREALDASAHEADAHAHHLQERLTDYEQALENERRLFEAELLAYRNRFSTVAADRLVDTARRVPALSSLGRSLRAALVRGLRR